MFSFGSNPMGGGSTAQSSGPLFGQSGGMTTGFGAGPLSLGAPPPATLPTIAQPMTGIPYPKETKFADLPPELRANLETIERTLRTAAEQSAALSMHSYAETSKLTGEVRSFEERLAACETASDTFKSQLGTAKSVLNQYWRYGETVARMLVASRQNTPEGKVKWVPVITPADFTLLDEMVLRLNSQIGQLAAAAAQLGRQLEQLGRPHESSAELLRSALKSQHDLFMGLTSRVALLNEQVDALRSQYKTFLAKYRNDLRDPFAPRSAAVAAQGSAPPVPTASNPVPPVPPPSALATLQPAPPLFSAAPSALNGKRLSFHPAQTPNPFLQTPR